MSAAKICSEERCDRQVVGRGMCRMHYLRAWRGGTLDDAPRTREKHECPTDHPHDLETCWMQHGCRCKGCVHLRHAERQRRRSRLAAYGRYDEVSPPRVPVGPVREHLLALQSRGFGLERIADAGQVPRSTVVDAAYGRRGASRTAADFNGTRTIRATDAQRILALSADDIDAALIPAVGTVRRLQALVAIGYDQSTIARRLGVQVRSMSSLILGKRQRVTPSTYRAVCDLFASLWEHPQTGTAADRARALAKRRRWVGPLAWDDIDHDETVPVVEADSGPDEMAIELAISGHEVRLTPAERRIAVRLLHAERWSDQLIAERLRVADRTVLRIRQELGLPAFEYAELRQAVSA